MAAAAGMAAAGIPGSEALAEPDERKQLTSGALLVIRNPTGTPFSPAFIVSLDIAHLGLVMVFLLVSLYCLIFKKHWTTER